MCKRVATLIQILPTADDKVIHLTEGTHIIGRLAGVDILLDSARLSRQHARIECTEAGCTIADLGSRNGTFVAGNPVSEQPVRLTNGAEIVLGGVIALRYDDPSATEQGAALGRLRGIWIDPQEDIVWVDGKRISPPLSAAQKILLQCLYDADGRPVNREKIIAAVWPDADPSGDTPDMVKSLISRLRKRLKQGENDYIEVIRERGVRLLQP